MNSNKIAKAIKRMAVAIMLGCMLVVAVNLVLALMGCGLPESWQYHETYYVVNPFWTVLLAGLFVSSFLLFIFSSTLAKVFAK